MSRSVKKAGAIVLDRKSRWIKKQHNHIVRKTEGIFNGNAHRKVTESWDICDWRFIKSRAELDEMKVNEPRRYHKRIGK